MKFDLAHDLLYILLLPLLAAAVVAVFLRRRGDDASLVSVLAAAGIAVLGLVAIFATAGTAGMGIDIASTTWLRMGGLKLNMGFLFDGFTVLMLFVVTFVGFWIHLFSLGYMKDDGAKGRYFGGLSIFMFSMLGIVLADNLFMIFVFWELVGFSSYLLINHYYGKDSAAQASKKAFIVNRVGDFGFLIGIIWLYWTAGTVNIAELAALYLEDPGKVATGIGLCLFCGVMGKSAQMPLHVWLPDAMEGPTPVSALIHAATMVAAGVYFLCRVFFLFDPVSLDVIGNIGALTAITTAFFAFCQNDIKKVLAYSTLSQLGFMVAAFGVGTKAFAMGNLPELDHPEYHGVGAAMFHLTTHAYFKALLFLGAGAVIHACHHEQDIMRMGGLAKRMKITFVTFTVGVLAISGVPLLSGFYSKDAILYVALVHNPVIFGILITAALFTALYMGRLWVLTFFGEPRSEHARKAKEVPAVMWTPLVVLAVLAALGGYQVLYPASIKAGVLINAPHPEGADKWLLYGISTAIAVVGLGGSFLYFRGGRQRRFFSRHLPLLPALSRSRFYFDELYKKTATRLQDGLASLLDLLNKIFIEGLLMRGLGLFTEFFAFLLRYVHTGSLHGYVYWFLAGVLIYVVYAFGWIN